MTRLHVLIDFHGAAGDGAPLRLAFGTPAEVLRANRAEEVRDVIDAAERHARAGRWCVGVLRYEAATAFEPSLAVHPADGPLAWFGVFDEPMPAVSAPGGRYAPLHWQGGPDRTRFGRDVARIHRAIEEGEVYQVNLTGTLDGRFEGDPLALFEALQRAQPQAYAAFVDTGAEQVLSVSPELFFDWRGGRLLARPMKGTAPRGATPQEDEARSRHLAESVKERAENLMIVDLIRNDVSRVAQPFGVTVPALFERRAWPTVWQMTSDVVARTRDGVTLSDVFAALFPCGSVTGAPKRRAMQWIRDLESNPRGVYCGAVGVLQPGGAATFNVPIRTVVLSDGRARCGIGSGITLDAEADDEWREWRHKRGFLERAREPFELVQTLRLDEGRIFHAPLHLDRLDSAARCFGYRFDRARAEHALRATALQHPRGAWRMRLLVDPQGVVRCEALERSVTPPNLRVRLAVAPVQAPPEFLRHKTTRRDHWDRFAPADPGVFDTLLWNAEGEVTEFTRGSVVVELPDGRRVTPPLRCGLLDGVGRAVALAEGVEEAVILRSQLAGAKRLWFVNALRGWLPVAYEAVTDSV